jgi:hypothetical protein
MRVLLIHPEDELSDGVWSHSQWGRVIDMGGVGGAAAEMPGVEVEGLPKLGASDFQRIRQALAAGSGVLIDSHGIDWWDLLSIEFHQQLERMLALRHVAETFAPPDEIFVSRPSLDARMLEALLGRELRFCLRPESAASGIARRAKTAFKLRPRQLIEILGDKYDGGYRLRRLVSPTPRKGVRPVVLIPSSYVNVSRGAVAYASAARELDFLLVTTRASGRMIEIPANVSSARLASYASGAFDGAELGHLVEGWHSLEKDLAANEELAVLMQLGVLSSVGPMLRSGLAVRDAWLLVFESAAVQSVLCGDEMNPSTRLPVLIAKRRGITALAFHHGALDGRYRYRDHSADLLLAKGPMEADYLTKVCRLADERIEIAPAPSAVRKKAARAGSSMVFFSEPYEVAGSRCRDVYRQVLPHLAKLARERECELVLKLHPQESRRERLGIAASVLRNEAFKILEGPLTQELLDQAWFAVTVSSTAAVDCTLAGIPAFLCRWLDQSVYQYGEQFVKFGAALPLNSAEEIALVPERLANLKPKVLDSICGEADASQLRLLLGGANPLPENTEVLAEKAWA